MNYIITIQFLKNNAPKLEFFYYLFYCFHYLKVLLYSLISKKMKSKVDFKFLIFSSCDILHNL